MAKLVVKGFVRKLALTNGNVITMDEEHPKAQAVFVVNGIITKVGTNTEVWALIDNETEAIDLKGKTLVPGFVDCHAHPMSFGQALSRVDCRTPPTHSIKEMVKKIRLAAAEKRPGEWIIGNGYDDFKLAEKRHPNRWDLDEAAPNNPVIVTRMCGHVTVANSYALRLGGVTKETKDPEGGRIDRDSATGEPTGVLRGPAQGLLRGLRPPATMKDLGKAINLASKEFLARGVTSVSDAGVGGADTVKAYLTAIREDGMSLRVNMMMSLNTLQELAKLGLSTGFGDEKIRIGAIKIVLDGSSTGRTAAVSEPYLDTPGNTGILYMSLEELNKNVLAAHRAGFQVGIHAIGDRAIVAVLDAYEAALKELPRKDHRHRIEHCGICSQSIVARIKALGVLPVPQPIFLYGEGESYRAGLGEERVKWAYPMKSFLENGIRVPMSSDCPATSGAELISPLLGIYVAVTRKTDAERELGPEQKISAYEGLKAYTLNSAYACFEEDKKGSIEPGKLADFAVLAEDPLTVPPERIKDISVDSTIVGGKVVYKKPQQSSS